MTNDTITYEFLTELVKRVRESSKDWQVTKF